VLPTSLESSEDFFASFGAAESGTKLGEAPPAAASGLAPVDDAAGAAAGAAVSALASISAVAVFGWRQTLSLQAW
jgi:hypothetical protein